MTAERWPKREVIADIALTNTLIAHVGLVATTQQHRGKHSIVPNDNTTPHRPSIDVTIRLPEQPFLFLARVSSYAVTRSEASYTSYGVPRSG